MKKVYVVIDAMWDFVEGCPDVVGVFETEEAAIKCKQDYIKESEESEFQSQEEYFYGAKDSTLIIESTLK